MGVAKIYPGSNQDCITKLDEASASVIYADMIYEDKNFEWIRKYWSVLKQGGVFIVQTDYHSVAEVKLFLDAMENSEFFNWLIYKQEWGGTPRVGFPQKHDDILIYCKGSKENVYWDKSKIQIPKVTAGTKLDKKGTGLKTPCSVFDDLGNFSTISKERIKNPDGKNIRWQKPEKLMYRLLAPFVRQGDLVVDPFMGTGTTGVVALELGCDFVGIEMDMDVFLIAKERLKKWIPERMGNINITGANMPKDERKMKSGITNHV